MTNPSINSTPLPDIQSTGDRRQVAINKVGVTNVRYPISLRTPGSGKGNEFLHTVATINMFVSLPHDVKGTHMSRFLEVLNEFHEELCSDTLSLVTNRMKEKLGSEDAYLELTFPYFINKKAPVTGQSGKLDFDVAFELASNGTDDFVMTLKVPATSLCPCSKEISEYGAHNQRCDMTVKVRMADGVNLWIEELFSIVEKCASTQVFSVLKRPDEKWVTEKAYENPKFVEDIVRDLAVALNNDDRIVWYQCSSENYESIHNHNAFAFIECDKREQ
ncbi:GTP cyclohydrolase FolE2 [Rhodopirellula sp. MGV]|uniref:GTP cyclohydrolase FolE2 n=1 Tax=Rhodopirellula sp. MGV TaxID=2023130 RepID=UPI000B96AFCB|nr:GTP cyclohydrolase FolE2 [Rhodopirellula sp. MGV]OYP30433.1 GTP cyclohydrolase I FolE2 [Rhodopirellula sp. MGV]PNY34778.1 GTP cyclohydrolase I FolE2 [Rhodopirellula baltica]